MLDVRTGRLGPLVSEGTRSLWGALERRRWTQADLARLVGTTSSMMNRWLHGFRRPGLRWALRIEQVTGVDAALWHEGPRGPLRLEVTPPPAEESRPVITARARGTRRKAQGAA